MISLSNPADKAARAQVAEAVSLIAQHDFPVQWSDLIDVSTPCSNLFSNDSLHFPLL